MNDPAFTSDGRPVVLRDPGEVQAAHDTIHCQVTGSAPFVLDPEDKILCHVALDVLCWVLRHDHVNGFADTLATIRDGLKIRGYDRVAIRPVRGPNHE